MRLMVLDDNVDAAETLSALLEVLGHEVGIAHTAQDALDTARRSAPRMLFLDIGRPDMDGDGLARRLRVTPPNTASALTAGSASDSPSCTCRTSRPWRNGVATSRMLLRGVKPQVFAFPPQQFTPL